MLMQELTQLSMSDLKTALTCKVSAVSFFVREFVRTLSMKSPALATASPFQSE